MERNEDLRNDDARTSGREAERVTELRDSDLRRADEGEGFTHSDSLVRDDSLVAGTGGSDLADRTDRTRHHDLDDLDEPLGHAREAVARSNVVHHDDRPTTGDHIGEAAGGISGVLAGTAIGSLGGPIGTVIGGIAGAVGGWWTGRAISEAASNFSHADDEHFRTDYETRGTASEVRRGDRSYEAVRPAYQLGYLASRNPDYAGRSFDEIEPDLQRGWSSDANVTGGANWADMRDYARTAYVRGAASQSSLTGDSSNKDSLSSTGTTGSVGTGASAPASSPVGTVGTMGSSSAGIDDGNAFGAGDAARAEDAASRREADANVPRLSKDTSLGDRSQRSEIGPPSGGGNFSLEGGASSSTSDPNYPGANPQGSMTYQASEPLTSSVNDSAGGRRSENYDNIGDRERGLHAHDSDERPGYTDPVAGEGVENISSSSASPRGGETLNENPESDAKRTEQDGRKETY